MVVGIDHIVCIPGVYGVELTASIVNAIDY